MKRTPLVLIAGFLGAGKTTFLQALLKSLEQRGIPASVIVNDFENADADATRLRASTSSLIEIISGACVCCSSLTEFMQKLNSIEIPDRGVLLVEANGASDFMSLIAAITASKETRRFMSPLQITLVDARRWQNRLIHNQLEREQVLTSTHWKLTHDEEMSPQRLALVREKISQLTPRGIETDADRFAKYLSILRSGFASTPAHENDPDEGFFDDELAEPHSHHHHAERAFTSMQLLLPPSVKHTELERVLENLPDSVLRVKGICRLDHCPLFFSFQHVRPENETWLLPMQASDLQPMAVIIGVNLPDAEIRELFGTLKESLLTDDVYQDALQALA